MTAKEIIARRAAKEIRDGSVVNLGAGLPVMCLNYIPDGISAILQSENGIVGCQALEENEEAPSFYCFDAANNYCNICPEGSVVDSLTAFGLIRGGHLELSILGTMQVDKEGTLANWTVPGGKLAGMGGAMDLVAGARRVIVTTEHCDRKGNPKILEKCTFPPTGLHCVDTIITEYAYISVTENGLVVMEISPDITKEELQAKTGAPLTFDENLKIMDIAPEND